MENKHRVILRDDDTNALTPPECLDRLYRPFLDRGLPVNLATIPNVRTNVTMADGALEGYLWPKTSNTPLFQPIAENGPLVRYLLDHSGYHLAQHGYRHDRFEFDHSDRAKVTDALKQGARHFQEAGFPPPRAFVAPHDRFTRVSLKETARHFGVISTGWFEAGRVPLPWWPRYLLKRFSGAAHWKVGQVQLLSHPGCLLSHHRNYETMLDTIRQTVKSRSLTVLVTHWWEYFRNGAPDAQFIKILHATADFLSNDPTIRVIAFDDLLDGPLEKPAARTQKEIPVVAGTSQNR